MLVSQNVPNILNGISQQPDAVRSPSQASEQINFDSDLQDGLTSRPRTAHVTTLVNDQVDPQRALHHFIDRGEPGQRWLVTIANTADSGTAGYLRIINADTGIPATVSYEAVFGIGFPLYIRRDRVGGYDTAPDFRSKLKALTVGDYTFILNTDCVVTAGADMTPRTIDPGRFFPLFSDLPTLAAGGILYAVNGAQGAGGNVAYFQYDASRTQWVETYLNGRTFLKATMPFAIRQTGPTTFQVVDPGWAGSPSVGNLNSVPYPSFVGRRLKDIFFHRNRLGIATEDGVVISRAGDFWNFWPKSVTQVLDDDPIDASLTDGFSSPIEWAIPYDGSVFLIGDGAQYRFEGADILSPRAFRATPVSKYECSRKVRPLVTAAAMYFTQDSGPFSRVQEYTPNSDVKVVSGFDLTEHCPRYIRGTGMSITASSIHNALFVAPRQGDSPDTSIYVYRHRTSERGERTQASWSRYVLPSSPTEAGRVRMVHMIQSRLYVVIERGGTSTLEMIDYDPHAGSLQSLFTDSDGEAFEPCLDALRLHPNGTISPADGSGTLFIGMYHGFANQAEVSRYALLHPEGWVLKGLQYKTSSMLLLPDKGHLAASLPNFGWYYGIPYESRYELSKLYPRDQQGTSRLNIHTSLRRLRLYLSKTPVLKILLQPKGRAAVTRLFNSIATGPIGGIKRLTGPIGAALLGRSDETRISFINDSIYPATITGYEWTGVTTTHSSSR